MNCLFCKQTIRSRDGEPICSECEEGANLAHSIQSAFEQWMDCMEQDNKYWRNALIHIRYIAENVDKALPLDQQALQMDIAVTELIRSVISFYHRDDIVAGTLVIKEFARVSMLRGDGPSLWLWVTEIEVACIIQQIVSGMGEDDFIGHSLGERDSGYYGFITAVVLARIQVMIRDNVERYRYKYFTDNLIDFAISVFEDQPLKDYFDKLHDMGVEEKPEDLEIINERLKGYLGSRSLLPEQIYAFADEGLKGIFSFTFDDIKAMVRSLVLEEEEFFLPVKLLQKDILFQKVEAVLPRDKAERILHFFSINTLSCGDKLADERKFELRSFYQTKDFVMFGKLDLMQNAGIFEKLVFSGHFLEMYLPGVEIPQVLRDSQNKMSTLMSYKIAEMLESAGYLVPHEAMPRSLGGGQVVRAEIGKILQGTNNILQGLGDIDVLAINSRKSEILLIELKYFKPGRTIREIVLSDVGKIESKRVVEKVLARQRAVMDNIGPVLSLFEKCNIAEFYHVRSILVTVRPNFKAVQEGLGVEYRTWNELKRLIKAIEL